MVLRQDPRQFVPASGQQFTTLKKLRTNGHKLVFKQDEDDDRIWSITIEPKAKVPRVYGLELMLTGGQTGIGQRAILIQTPQGNVLWDLVCFLDKDAIEKVLNSSPLTPILHRNETSMANDAVADQLPWRIAFNHYLPSSFLYHLVGLG